jgi:transposase
LQRLRTPQAGDATPETLELVPAQWKVIQRLREKFLSPMRIPSRMRLRIASLEPGRSCWLRSFRQVPGATLLNRQSDIYANEGMELDTSTLAGSERVLRPWCR